MMRAVVYARKSSDNEAGVERQVEIARDFIAKQEWRPGPVFSDNAISGATYDRPGLNTLREYMRKIGRKGGRVVTPKKRESLARARAVKAAKRAKRGRS